MNKGSKGLSYEEKQKAIEMMKKTGVTITKDDIADCHRVGRFHDGSRPIIVRFVNRRKRTEVMRNKKALRDKDECKKVYLNDDLTSLRARLLKYVKDLPKVDKAWTIGGRIFCEKKKVPGVPLPEQSKPVIIESPDDLVKLGETTVDSNLPIEVYNYQTRFRNSYHASNIDIEILPV